MYTAIRPILLMLWPTFILAQSASTPSHAGPSRAEVCPSLTGPAFRALTTPRKFKLAAAYFVNPELVEKSKILDAFAVNEIISDRKTDDLWSKLSNGSARLAIASNEKDPVFVTVSFSLWRSASSCASQGVETAFPEKVNFSSKELFATSLRALSKADASRLWVITDQLGSGAYASKPSGSVVTWDWSEAVSVPVSRPSPKGK